MSCRRPLVRWKTTGRGERVTIPCGQCYGCIEDKRREWFVRLNSHLESADSASFITLTYEDEKLPKTSEGIHTLCKEDLQKFFKRLRYYYKWKKIKYYAVGEYGTKTERPHYHAIIFNLPSDEDILLDLLHSA